MKERIKTYIQGLDEEIDGGIPKGHVVLISGAPGTMKSSLALNILYYNSVRDGKNGLYISLEQSRSSLIEQALGLGMDLDKVEEKIRIIDIGYLRKSMKETESVSWMSVFKMYAENLKSALDYDIMVADSLTVFDLFLGGENRRMELFELFEWMRDMKCTTFVIAESTPDAPMKEEDYLADGVIRLSKERVGSRDMQRLIYIDKMREVNHATSIFTLLFEEGKFQVSRAI